MTVPQKLKHELTALGLAAGFFGSWIAALLLLKQLLLAEYQIAFHGLSMALIGALVLSKVVLVLEHVPLCQWLNARRVWSDLLLVSSAKGSYDTVRSEVLQMAAKVSFLDRVLHLYGPDAAALRAQFHTAVTEGTRQMWAAEGSASNSNAQTGDALYVAIQALTPQSDTPRTLKAQAASLAVELGQLRSLMHAQSLASVSRPLLVVVVVWLVMIFFSFSLLAPPTGTATLALIASACSVAGAIFLILEMDQPFRGLIHISNEPMLNALRQIAP